MTGNSKKRRFKMRIIGIDLGKISLKAVLLNQEREIEETFWKVHQQEIEKVWQELQKLWKIGPKDRVVVTGGKLRQLLPFPSIVERVAQEKAIRFLYPQEEVTLIKMGGGGSSVLKIKEGRSEYIPSPRCAVGTGSFLDQILARVGLTISQADEKVREVKGLEITSRCAVTKKTDFTHLLNQGNRPEEVIAGLLDSSAREASALALKTPLTSRVLIIGGLSASQRIVNTIKESLPTGTLVEVPSQALYFEALGAALIGLEKIEKKIEQLSQVKKEISSLVFLPSLKNYLSQVTKITSSKEKDHLEIPLIIGLDIGSTGSKMVTFGSEPIFEAYTETKGQPVQAAQDLIRKIPNQYLARIKAVGCTGSGREIVANLLRASLPEERHQQIFVLNEIASHAQGAIFYDPQVDTVVDIGGQDSKFIRLENGRMVDFCMNTVCSAGTGSFLAEQLQLLGIKDVREFGKMALNSPRAVDLGQHCAVFVAEQIDEAKRKGAKLEEIVAGLYYSIVLNYNNRVKGLREYGKKIFLQGKPAENLALAAALAKVTGNQIIVPPSPGSMGALGIAILAKKELSQSLKKQPSLNLKTFLESQILTKREFRCQSKEGCLVGNLCPIQMIEVKVDNQKSKFFWGGACDKYEKVGKSKVLVQAPQPFLEREKIISRLIVSNLDKKKTIGIPRALEIEEILPLSITFFQELGLRVKLTKDCSLKTLEEGAKLCQATFCAPFQILGGETKTLDVDFLFLPKVIEIPGLEEEKRCFVCPLSQAAPDLFFPKLSIKVLQPLLNFKEGYGAKENQKEFLKIGKLLGFSSQETLAAFSKAVKAQEEFEKECQRVGNEALKFARRNNLPVIVILGHPYIVHSSLLSAGIAEAIQENGAIALPADFYPQSTRSPILRDIYWGYGHRLLNLAYEIRRQPGIYPLWLSVYSCGPDSFLLHFFQYLSQGKPYTILESDAYTGQAGFKTRIEAFLYGIRSYQEIEERELPDLKNFEIKESFLSQIKESRKVLFPWMGEGSKIVAALFKAGTGMESEALPMADQEALEIGRKYTSGKECLPMIVTVGSLLKYLAHQKEKFYYFMPRAGGPCRFGQYQLLTKIILEKAGLKDRVEVVSPTSETGYRLSEQFGPSMVAKAWTGIVFSDLLKDALLEKRPEEKIIGRTQELFDYYIKEAERMILETSNNWLGYPGLWGMKRLAERAARDFSRISQNRAERKPLILVTGEIYVRLDEFSNNFLIRELENLGLKVKLAPFREWANYTTYIRRKHWTLDKVKPWRIYPTWLIQKKIERDLYQIFAEKLDWPEDHSIEEILKTAKPYLSELRPLGEAALTIGLSLLLWKKKEITGAVIVGPFECMPTRIAETQLGLISQQTGLPILSLSFHGEPLEKELLESFVWELRNYANKRAT